MRPNLVVKCCPAPLLITLLNSRTYTTTTRAKKKHETSFICVRTDMGQKSSSLSTFTFGKIFLWKIEFALSRDLENGLDKDV